MKVLMLSTDAKILEKGTDTRARMLNYGTLFEELHIIVLSGRKLNIENEKLKINERVFIYPTNSRNKLFALLRAYNISKTIIGNWKLEIGNYAISVQDPFETGLVGYMLKRKFKIALQVQVHTDFFSPHFAAESWKNRLRVLIGRRIVRAADGVRTVSERVKRTLVGEGDVPEEKIAMLPIFVDVHALRAATVQRDLRKAYPQFSFIILMASRLTREKHIGLALVTMHEVAKKYPHAGLVIVGEGPEQEKLKTESEKLKVNDRVVFEGWTDDLASYYKSADLFLITSDYEGYSRTAVGAAACGLPVVMTDVGVAGELIVTGFNGIVVPVGDAIALSRAIVGLLDRPALRGELGRHGSEVAQTLPSKDEYLRRYKEALEGIIHTNRV